MIAIIAVLAAIILVNVNGYVNKSRIAAVQSELRQLSFAATTFYEANGTLTDFCWDATSIKIMQAVKKINTGYSVSCWDKQGLNAPVYNAFNYNPWVAYAVFIPVCDAGGTVFQVGGLPTSLVPGGYLCGHTQVGSGSDINVYFQPGSSVANPTAGCWCGI